MPLRLKGVEPRPGQVDRRYYLIDVQECGRRVRLSSGVRDRQLASVKEQAVLDALREDLSIPRETLVEMVRGRIVHRIRRNPSRPMAMTLKQACDEALADTLPWGRGKSGWAGSPSRSTYAAQLREVQCILGPDLEVTAIEQDVINRVVHALRSDRRTGGPNSGTTVNRKMFAFFSVLRRLHERGLPAPQIPKYVSFDESEGVRQFVFTSEQERELLEAVLKLDQRPSTGAGGRIKRDAHVYRDLFVFLSDVGCRLSAALGVSWADLVESDGRPCVRFFRRKHLKGGRPRTTPLTARAAEVVARRRNQGGRGPFDGLSKRRAEQIWSAAKAATSFAGEADAVIHALRHTCATRLLQVTGDIKLVQEWLGHSSLQTTADIYAKVLVQHKINAVPAFEGAWNR